MQRFWLVLLLALGVLAAPSATVRAQDEEETGDDIDCFEFTYQEEAQAELDADPSDPYNLDPNDDGIACALLPSEADAENGAAATPTAEDDEALDAETTAGEQSNEAAQDTNAGNNNNRQGNAGRNRNQNNQTDQTDVTPTAEAGNNNNDNNDRPNRNRNRNDQADTAVVCDDFETQEEAQAELDADGTLADSLDTNGDGVACSEGDDVSLEETDTGGTFVCDDYDTQGEAQAAFDVDPDLLADLDTNGDGLACSDGDDVVLDAATDTDVVAVDRSGDLDCIDFDTQEEAQAVFDDDPTDPNNLDPSDDGFACSELPSEDGTVRVSSVPNTGTGTAAALSNGRGGLGRTVAAALALVIVLGLALLWGTSRPTRVRAAVTSPALRRDPRRLNTLKR